MSARRIAAIQMQPELGAVEQNLRAITRAIESVDAALAVFPECALTGYAFGSADEARPCAQSLPGPGLERIVEACSRSGAHAVVGTIERDGERLFNSALLAGPGGLVGVYRKMHLPFLGVDRFMEPGDRGFPVFDTPVGRIGLLICYDGSFPEAARLLKLGGAQLICLPTNWPMAAEVSCRYSPMVRAQENHVNFVACNRTGEEGGFRFRGESKICDFEGRILASAGSDPEALFAGVDLEGADRNRVVNVPGEYELDRIAHRRPDHYSGITSSKTIS